MPTLRSGYGRAPSRFMVTYDHPSSPSQLFRRFGIPEAIAERSRALSAAGLFDIATAVCAIAGLTAVDALAGEFPTALRGAHDEVAEEGLEPPTRGL